MFDNEGRKNQTSSTFVITSFFGATNPYKKIDEQQQQFIEDLVLYICKGYKPLSTWENVWLWRFCFTPKPLCIISFLIFFCGGKVANHGEKDHGPLCFSKSYISNSGFC
jgi:hypothetical protein